MSANPLAPLERTIGGLFRWGVAVSAATFAVGLALSAGQSPLARPVLNGGLVLLMAIPVVRVVASSVDAARRRDALLIGATLVVIVELIWLFVRKS